MKLFLLDLLVMGLKHLGKLVDKFFKSQRGKRVKGWLPEAAAIIGLVAARTENTVDDAVAVIAQELGLGDKSVEELLTGPWGDIIKRLVAKRILQEMTKATDSEANLALELAYNQVKNGEVA